MKKAIDIIKIASRVGSDYYGFNIAYEDITGDCRKKEFVSLRHISMKIIRDTYHMTVTDVSRYFNRNYTSVVTGCKSVVDLIYTRDEQYCYLFNKIIEELEKKENETITATIIVPKYTDPSVLLEKLRINFGIEGKLNVA